METAPLKSFATWARTALIREVSARISVVLASEVLRLEQPNAVAALEKAVDAAGGSDKGRDTVADKVAYIWFNRIIALRFMDAKAYTGIGVVSPERGREGGQPEVLAEAKRGNIDSMVVTNTRTAETVTSLLNGTRRSDDPQGEAYALLLAEYCRHWNRSMPFMFEREGDYTELLIPANLLADDSVLARAATVLTEDVCQDVEVIGWLYQFYISERKDEVFAGFKKNKKAGADEIPAATQLFTPHWIVRYLVENSLGRLWLLNRPTSHLADQMEYYVAPVDEETDFLKVSSPEELKVIDPACGSGHMLTYAFDLLYAIYEEEGYAPSDIPALILTNNLYGTEIDPRAGALAAFALTMKARARQRTFFTRLWDGKPAQPKVCVLEPISFAPGELEQLLPLTGNAVVDAEFWNLFQHANSLGSLVKPEQVSIDAARSFFERFRTDESDLLLADTFSRVERVLTQAEYLSQRYSVVVANPPYMGAKNMSPLIAQWAALRWPKSKADLMTMFMERAASLALRGGYWAMINLPSWMFLSTFAAMREHMLSTSTVSSLLQLGRGVFGSDFGSTAFVIANRMPPSGAKGLYRRLFSDPGQVRTNAKIEALFLDRDHNCYVAEQSDFEAVPGMPIAYWLPAEFFETFKMPSRIGSAAKKGLSCSSTDLYYRFVWEVSRRDVGDSSKAWVPITKGGPVRKWYGNNEYVILWENNGREIRSRRDASGKPSAAIRNEDYYFREGVSWNDVSMTGLLSARHTPEGSIPTDSGPMIYSTGTKALEILGFLNSTAVRPFTDLLCPTIHFGVGQLATFPLTGQKNAERDVRVNRLIEIARDDWDESETSVDFARSPILKHRMPAGSFADALNATLETWRNRVEQALQLERENDEYYLNQYGLNDLDIPVVEAKDITLLSNPDQRYGRLSAEKRPDALLKDTVTDFVSYAVGCMFGRFSLDAEGLLIANHGETVADYLMRVPHPSFRPDQDNVIPIVDGDWFEDDVVARFRQFLRVTFGEEQLEENLRFVTQALGVRDMRDYFMKSFYRDHVQRYKKRPIYWLFASPKGSFNALIYMHRYTPSTVSTVLNEYLREFKAKLAASREHHERLAAGTGTPRQLAAAQKEVDRLRKVLLELDEYEHDVLYPLASRQVQIDLDDGVKANYPKLGAALKKIPGLEANDE